MFNSTSGMCECEWIPGFGPGLGPVKKREAGEERQSIESCTGIFCIAEQHPVWNATSGHCECEWIPGLGPVTVG